MDRNQLIRKQLILDRVNLIKQVSGGEIKTCVENFQMMLLRESRVSELIEDNIYKNDNIDKICEKY